jgi:hypothetical protein
MNGKTIQDHVIIPGPTRGGLEIAEGEPGPIMLQCQKGPIKFRRIRLREIH